MALALAPGLFPTTATAQVSPQPDALIRRPSQGAYSGNDVYNLTGAGQSRSTMVGPGGLTRFYIRVQNDGYRRQGIRVVGTPESGAFAVRYFVGTRQVSPLVKNGTFVFHGMAPGAARTLTLEVEAKGGAPRGSRRVVTVSARSAADGSFRDNVVAEVRIPEYTSNQRRIASFVNQSRGQHGLQGLPLHRQLTDKAQAWAEKLSRDGHLSHSYLPAGVPSGWLSIAENVGYGSTIGQVHNAFMASSHHRENVLGNHSHLGTGFATGHGRVWIVHVFMRR